MILHKRQLFFPIFFFTSVNDAASKWCTLFTYFFIWQMGDPSVEVTEEMQDAAQLAKSKAMDAISEGMALSCCDL